MERKGLTKLQKICFILLWVALCVMLFSLPSEKSMRENVFIAIVSGIIIFVGISFGPNKMNRRNRK
jgi:hypothetical protein